MTSCDGDHNKNTVEPKSLKWRRDIARRRWHLLAATLTKKKQNRDVDTVSVRRFSSFGLIEAVPVSRKSTVDDDDTTTLYEYLCEDHNFSARIKIPIKSITAEELMGFNNTGNVCVWPSEEVLGYYCLENKDMFQDKVTIELGGGMTCLAGLMIAKNANPKTVILSDGNEAAVKTLSETLGENDLKDTVVQTAIIQWNKKQTYLFFEEKADFVICADCLFFEEGREDLVEALWFLLKRGGIGFIMAPQRRKTFDTFVQIAKKRFICTAFQKYSAIIWKLHEEFMKDKRYDVDLHYPLLLKIVKES